MTEYSRLTFSQLPLEAGLVTSAHPASVVAAPLCATGVFFLLMLAGTGGAVTSSAAAGMAGTADATSTTCRVEHIGGGRREERQIVETAEKLAFVQDQFSLNLSGVAAILRVSRPTVYSWLREDWDPQTHNLSRIERLYGLAQIWRRLSLAPLGRYVRRPLYRNTSILSLLSNQSINESAVRAAFSIAQRALERTEGPRRSGRTITAELMERYGFPEPTPEEQDQAISGATGI